MTQTMCIEVCPSSEELSVEDPSECTVLGCGKVFKSSACLQMHLRRRHEGKPLPASANGEKRVYYCPVGDCERRKGKENPFPRLGQLKQHFQAVHSDKKYRCCKCSKVFGLKDVCKRHEAECGQLFRCSSCEETFRSRNALYQHAKRKNHTIPQGRKCKNLQKMPDVFNPSATAEQSINCSASVQTKDPHHSQYFIPTDSSLFTSSGCQTLDLDDQLFNHLIHAKNTNMVLLSGFTSISSHMTLVTSQSCQTQSQDSSEFGTQTTSSYDYLLETNLESQTIVPKLEDYNDLDLNSLLPPGCMSLGTQTYESVADCLEFGVQTFMQTDTKDQESQT